MSTDRQPEALEVVAPKFTDRADSRYEIRSGSRLVGSVYANQPEAERIAREFATASDMLEALKAMHALMENLWKAVPWGQTFDLDVEALNTAPQKVSAAIAKAEGRAS